MPYATNILFAKVLMLLNFHVGLSVEIYIWFPLIGNELKYEITCHLFFSCYAVGVFMSQQKVFGCVLCLFLLPSAEGVGFNIYFIILDFDFLNILSD